MSPNIPENVAKYSEEYCQIFWGMSPNILGNVAKYSGECHKKFREMSPNIPGNIIKDSVECPHGLTFKFNGRVSKHVLLNYLLFAVDFTSAKKSTKIMLSSKMLLYILSSESLIFIYKS